MMFKGGDGTPENSQKTSGWMARFYIPDIIMKISRSFGIQLG